MTVGVNGINPIDRRAAGTVEHHSPLRLTIVFTLVGSAILLFPTIFWPFDYDQGTFAYGGWAVLHGLRPYIDFWDIKPPNIFYTYAAAFALFGNSVRAIRIFDYLNVLLSIGLLYALSLRLWKNVVWNQVAAVLASLVFIVQYYIFGHWNTAQTETYSTPLLLGAMLLVVPRGEEHIIYRGKISRSFFAGVLLGISFYFKFPNALYVLLLGAAMRMYARDDRWKAITYLIIGFVVSVSLESLYLGFAGELIPLWKLTTSETASYVSSNYSGSFTVLRNLRTSIEVLDWFWVVAAAFGWVLWSVRRASFKAIELRAILLMFLACLFSFVIVQAENKGYTYHYGILLPWADILIGGGIAYFAVAITKWDRLSATGNGIFLAGILLLGCFFWSSRNPLQGRTAELIGMARGLKAPNGYIAGDSISDFVEVHAAPNDRIFIFGFQPYVYWKTGRKPASKFINTIHFKSTPVAPWERDELVHDLTGNPPTLFLVETQDRYTSQGNSGSDSRSTIQLHYPELEQLLNTEYYPEDTIEGTIIYRYHGIHG